MFSHAGQRRGLNSPGWSQRYPAAALHRRYLAAFLCIACLIVLDQLLIQPELARLSSDAPVINVSGRQRMLSQNLAKTSLVLIQESDPERRTSLRNELEDVLALWTRSHHGLQAGDTEMSLPGNNPPEIVAAFKQLEMHFQAIKEATEELLALTAPGEAWQVEDARRSVAKILRHEPSFLAEMHELVGIYEQQTRQHVVQLERTSWTIAVGILATMVVLHLIAIRPATQLLEREYRETQGQYQAVVESIDEGLLLLDLQGRVRYANRQFGKMLEVDSDQLVGFVAMTLFLGTRYPLWPRSSATETLEAALPEELELPCRDGSRKPVWVSPHRLLDDEGELNGWVVLVVDITEQREAERQTRLLADQLTHADRLKSIGEIAAGLAHEVNQPLGAIANFSEGCLTRIETGGCATEELLDPLRRIRAAALRAGGIIHRVKKFSQKRPHTIAPADWNGLVEEAVSLCEIELKRRRVICHLQLAPGPLELQCDALQVSQVLTNLIQNAMIALEANPQDDRHLTITTSRPAENQLEVRVSDNGPGIPAEIMSSLFESFSTSRPEGLGMGLAIVRSIVEAHQGTIRAENSETGGAVLIVRCPCRQTLDREETYESTGTSLKMDSVGS